MICFYTSAYPEIQQHTEMDPALKVRRSSSSHRDCAEHRAMIGTRLQVYSPRDFRQREGRSHARLSIIFVPFVFVLYILRICSANLVVSVLVHGSFEIT